MGPCQLRGRGETVVLVDIGSAVLSVRAALAEFAGFVWLPLIAFALVVFAAVLASLRGLGPGRLLVVVGAGGDRDPGKRPLMGAVAAELADVVVVTDDNPRTEEPATIRAAIMAGAQDANLRGATSTLVEIGDRRAAIAHAVADARPGDTVVVAGKGDESGQVVGDVVQRFDDREVLAEALRDRGRRVG